MPDSNGIPLRSAADHLALIEEHRQPFGFDVGRQLLGRTSALTAPASTFPAASNTVGNETFIGDQLRDAERDALIHGALFDELDDTPSRHELSLDDEWDWEWSAGDE